MTERDEFVTALTQERDALQVAVRELYLYIADEVDVMPLPVEWYIPKYCDHAREVAKVACADITFGEE